MKAKLILSALLCFSFYLLSSQSPHGFNYQAVAMDAGGAVLVEQPLTARISILTASTGGTLIWEETHAVTTNKSGLISFVVGTGNRTGGSASGFSDISWSTLTLFLKTEIDPGSGYITMGTTQIWSVPYSMTAKNTETKQTLSLAGSDLSISGGNTVTLPSGGSLWQTDGTNIYRWSNVGIVTNNPLTKLHVADNLNVGITYPLYLQNASGDWTAAEKGVGLKFGRMNPTSGHDYGTIRGTIASGSGGDGRLQFIGGGGDIPHMTINHLGNVGIGTISPTALLDVKTSENYHFGAFYNTAGASSIGAFTDGFVNWQPLSINPGGQVWFMGPAVGIGTTTPGFKLDVIGDIRSTGKIWANASGAAYFRGGDDTELWDVNVANTMAIYGLQNNAVATIRLGSGAADISGSNGNIGIGTSTPTSKLTVNSPAAWSDEVPLFEVKNKSGIPVFAVYNNGVRILVDDNSTSKGIKGGFAIGGFDNSKTTYTGNLVTISPDSIRFNINNATSKGVKGGFGIGSYGTVKAAANQDFMYITPQASGNGLYNTFLGYLAGKSNVTGQRNVFVGNKAGFTNYGTVFPNPATGNDNVFVGTLSGEISLGNNNVYIGSGAGKKSTVGSRNTYIGAYAGSNDLGSDNVLIGYNAGFGSGESNLLAIGNGNNSTLITGYFNTSKLYLWADVGIGLGDPTQKLDVNGSARFRAIGSGSTSKVLYITSDGTLTTSTSDFSKKKDIETIKDAMSKVLEMNGVYYRWKDDPDDSRKIGFIAQEMEKVLPEVVFTNNTDGLKGINYPEITAVLTEAIKEQQKQIETQNEKIARLEKLVESLILEKTLTNEH